jgi:hypothetical protein
MPSRSSSERRRRRTQKKSNLPILRINPAMMHKFQQMESGKFAWANLMDNQPDPTILLSEIRMTESEHRPSSGMSDMMTRGPRREHYKRKAELEAHKEAARFEKWKHMYPMNTAAGWNIREHRRKTRKAAQRKTRKEIKA